MTHWKIKLAYNGTGFHGWQIQPGLVTVQGTLAQALHRITGETLLPQGAGRTDTGVHALGQAASFALASAVPPENLQRALNRVLPAGIRVTSAQIVPPSFHARHSARGKLYEYRIFERRARTPAGGRPHERVCSPFLAPFVWDCRWPLDLESMQQAARCLIGTQDFSAMAASNRNSCDLENEDPTLHPDKPRSSAPNPVKTIYEASWRRGDDDQLFFRIRGSGFLHHMVRNVVGTLVDIGRGSLGVDDLPRILASRDRALAGPTAPASGLYLVEVHYPPESPNLQLDPYAAAEVNA